MRGLDGSDAGGLGRENLFDCRHGAPGTSDRARLSHHGPNAAGLTSTSTPAAWSFAFQAVPALLSLAISMPLIYDAPGGQAAPNNTDSLARRPAMPLEVTFTLDDQDLDYFRDVMNKAQDAAESLSEIDVVKRAQAMLDEVRNDVKAPQFVLQRLGRLQSLISMLDDADWPLAESEHQDVISALAYFCLLYTSPSPRDRTRSRMPSSA